MWANQGRRDVHFTSVLLVPSFLARIVLGSVINMASMSEGSKPKKRKLSQREKKKLMSEKGKKSAESRGKGVLSRQDFVLPAKWESEVRQGESREIVEYYSPGKTKYRTQSDVKKVLQQRGMALCLDESDSLPPQPPSSESDASAYDPDEDQDHEGEIDSSVIPSTSKSLDRKSTKKSNQLEVEQRLFVCETTQVCKFVDDINKTSRCSTEECNGKCMHAIFSFAF